MMLSNEKKEYNILYIEDDLEDFEYINLELKKSKRAKFNLDCATDSDEVFERNLKKYDLILVDYRLPTIDGIELINKLKKSFDINLPFVIFTAMTDKNIDERALENGIDDYLIKGKTDTTILERTILYCIERWKNKKSLIETKVLLENVIDHMSHQTFLLSEDGTILMINKSVKRIFSDKVLNLKFDDVFDFFPYEEDIFKLKIKSKIKIKNKMDSLLFEPYQDQGVVRHIDNGTKLFCDLYAKKIKPNGKKFIIITMSDNYLIEKEKEVLRKVNKNLEDNIKKYGIEKSDPYAIIDLVNSELNKISKLEEA